MKHLLLTTIAAVLVVGCGGSIHDAARDGNIKAVEQHLAAGTDVNAKDVDGWTPLDMAPDKETADLLSKHGGKHRGELEAEESIHIAAEFGHLEAVRQHLVDGMDVNAKDDDGQTPFYIAAQFASKEIVELLIANGADVNAKAKSGWTPLHHAAIFGRKEAVELLIEKGVDVNAKYEDGGTPLDEADGETADLLRKHGGKTGEELKAEEK